jgi:hypothetical protein
MPMSLKISSKEKIEAFLPKFGIFFPPCYNTASFSCIKGARDENLKRNRRNFGFE